MPPSRASLMWKAHLPGQEGALAKVGGRAIQRWSSRRPTLKGTPAGVRASGRPAWELPGQALQAAGSSHFEGRSYRGWQHHVTCALACYAFLVAERARAFPPLGPRGEKRPLDRVRGLSVISTTPSSRFALPSHARSSDGCPDVPAVCEKRRECHECHKTNRGSSTNLPRELRHHVESSGRRRLRERVREGRFDRVRCV